MEIDFSKLKISELLPNSEFEEKVIKFIKNWFLPESSVQVQTSGSTGIPKIIQVDKSKMLYSAKMTMDYLKLKEGDLALLCLPIEYISGKMMVVRSLARKLQLKIHSPTTTPLQALSSPVDFAAVTPLQVENSLDKLHYIKNLIIGGAGVAEQLQQKIKAQLDNSGYNGKIYETYGMSETLSHIALKELYPKKEDFFTAFEGVTIKVDQRGCLIIQAPGVSDEVIVTNDLVEIINENQFRFLGRADNVINSGGLKVMPEEIEKVLNSLTDRTIVIFPRDDEKLGQKICLAIEGDTDEELIEAINNFSFEKKAYRPKEIHFLEKVPRIPNGKLDRLSLKKRFN